jgi:hypothetical protein
MNAKQKTAILDKLKGMETSDLNEVVAALAKFSEKNLVPHDIFPEGIIIKDSARARFVLTPEKHKDLMDLINANPKNPLFRDFTVFPLGIIAPDLYDTRIRLGKNVR